MMRMQARAVALFAAHLAPGKADAAPALAGKGETRIS